MRNKARTSIKFIAIVCLFAVFSSALFLSSDSFALNLTDTVDLIQGNHSMVFDYYDCSTSPTCSNGLYVRNFNNQYTIFENLNSDTTNAVLFQFTVSIPNRQYAVADYITLDFYIMNASKNDSGDYYAKSFTWAGANGWDIVDVQYSTIGPSSGKISITIKCYTAGTYGGATFSSSSNGAIALKTNEYFMTGLATVWRPRSGTNYTGSFNSVISAIENQPNYTQNLNNIRNDIQGLADAQEQANQDANERYEDEKQTIQDNADAAQDDYDSLDNSSASILNPFTPFFTRISNSSSDCVSIPNIAQWIHWQGNNGSFQVCSPWPARVRTVLAYAVIALLTFALFITIVRYGIKFKSGAD